MRPELFDRLCDIVPGLADFVMTPEQRMAYHGKRAIAALMIGRWLYEVIRWHEGRHCLDRYMKERG